ncbi:ABC transporter permease subunit [bacterium]|nr:ABC transporter permease subunit [bacterium]
MVNIFFKTLKDKKWSIVVYCFFGVIMLWMYISLFPSVKDSAASVSDFVKRLPPELNKAFGLDPASFGTFEGLLGSKIFSLVWPLMLAGILVSMSASYISGEVERGTIEISLAQPVSRVKIIISKILAGISVNLIFIIFSIIAVIPMAHLTNIPLKDGNFILLSIVGFMLGLAILGISTLISSISSDKGRVALSVSGILLIMYVLFIFALLSDKVDYLKYFSFFYYFNYSDILLLGKVDIYPFIFYLVTFITSISASIFIFNKRDIS